MVVLEVPADGASEHLFLSVTRVVAAHRTRPRTRTFGKLLLRVLAHVITVALLFMTRLAEMGVAPAEPLSNTTAKLALEFDEIFAMLGTVLNWYFTAVGANELLCIEGASCVLRFVHGGYAVLPATKVRLLALEAHEVGIDDVGVLLGLAEVRRSLFP
jgi:hypothetical protein